MITQPQNTTIPQSVIDRIREAADLIEILKQSGVELTHRGSYYKGLCPFHTEKNASFTIGRFTQKYHCFGCGKNGDVFQFFMDKSGFSFPESVRHVAALVNLGYLIP